MASNTAIVRWTANTEPDLAGYRVYYGISPGIWINWWSVSAGTTSYTFTAGLPPIAPGNELIYDGRWYFAVSAFDTSNNESALTAAVSKYITRVRGKLRRRV